MLRRGLEFKTSGKHWNKTSIHSMCTSVLEEGMSSELGSLLNISLTDFFSPGFAISHSLDWFPD